MQWIGMVGLKLWNEETGELLGSFVMNHVIINDGDEVILLCDGGKYILLVNYIQYT